MKPVLAGILASILLCLTLVGCAASRAEFDTEGMSTRSASAPQMAEAQVSASRMMIWTAFMRMRVSDVEAAAARALVIAESEDGFLETRSVTEDRKATLVLRIPAPRLSVVLEEIGKLGSVTEQRATGRDVTEEYVDLEARLENHRAMRDRLKDLMIKATLVTDLLALERELSRVQGEIDSMEARMKSLRSRSDFSTITLSLERRRILGPLGYAFKGLFWSIEKLFVIR